MTRRQANRIASRSIGWRIWCAVMDGVSRDGAPAPRPAIDDIVFRLIEETQVAERARYIAETARRNGGRVQSTRAKIKTRQIDV